MSGELTCCMDINTWEQVCLACGTVTAKQKRRLLSTLSKDNSIVLLLRRLYRCELTKMSKMLLTDRLKALISDNFNASDLCDGYICVNCSKSLMTFCKKEENLLANVAKVLDILPTVDLEVPGLVPQSLFSSSGEPATAVLQDISFPHSQHTNSIPNLEDSISHPCSQSEECQEESATQLMVNQLDIHQINEPDKPVPVIEEMNTSIINTPERSALKPRSRKRSQTARKVYSYFMDGLCA